MIRKQVQAIYLESVLNILFIHNSLKKSMNNINILCNISTDSSQQASSQSTHFYTNWYIILYQCPLYAHTNRNSLNRFSKIYEIHISLTSHSTYSNTQCLIYPLLTSNLFKTVTRMYIITRAKIIPSLTNLLQPIFFYTSTYSFSTHIKSSIRERRIARRILSPGR